MINIGELTHFAPRKGTDIVVTVGTFLNDNCIATCDRILGYSH